MNKKKNSKSVKIYNADSRNMREVKNNSVHLIATSPPYWDLKNYKNNRQIGLGQSYEEYLKNLNQVFQECYRVLKPGRFLALVIGTRVDNGELKHIPADCINILSKLNFTLKKEIIWTKPKGTQGLWQRGCTKFLKTTPFPLYANFNIQHEFILIFQKNGDLQIDPSFLESNKLDEQYIKDMCWSNWIIPVSRQKKHPAPYPEELTDRLIKLYSFPDEIILDPFIGSGTTAISAIKNNRKAIGYEISAEFCEMCTENMEAINCRMTF